MAFSASTIDATVRLYDGDGNLIPNVGVGNSAPMQLGRISFDPDAMDLDGIGAAHSLRGRVVRAFFRLMQLWPAS
jgi:hypothetical protein